MSLFVLFQLMFRQSCCWDFMGRSSNVTRRRSLTENSFLKALSFNEVETRLELYPCHLNIGLTFLYFCDFMISSFLCRRTGYWEENKVWTHLCSWQQYNSFQNLFEIDSYFSKLQVRFVENQTWLFFSMAKIINYGIYFSPFWLFYHRYITKLDLMHFLSLLRFFSNNKFISQESYIGAQVLLKWITTPHQKFQCLMLPDKMIFNR